MNSAQRSNVSTHEIFEEQIIWNVGGKFVPQISRDPTPRHVTRLLMMKGGQIQR